MNPLLTGCLLSFVLTSVLVTGCGGGKYQPVTGEIVFTDDTPVTDLQGGGIVFQKVGSPEAPTPSSSIDASGKFTLGTDQLNDGAPEGDYQIVITPPQPTGDEQLPKVIADKHTMADPASETFTVKPGKNHFKVKVERAR